MEWLKKRLQTTADNL